MIIFRIVFLVSTYKGIPFGGHLKQEGLGLSFLFITLPTLSLSGLMFSENCFQLPGCALTELTVETVS